MGLSETSKYTNPASEAILIFASKSIPNVSKEMGGVLKFQRVHKSYP